MAARTGKEFLERLRATRRPLRLEGALVDDVTTHPALAGAAQTLAGIFDRQRTFADDCLTPDPETGEPGGVGHMLPRSIDDLKRRNRGLARISEATVGLMGRTPDYMSVKFASFAARWRDWLGADGRNDQGAHNLVRFQKRIARDDVCLTHTIIRPSIDKSTDAQLVGKREPLHKVGETATGIVVRDARILATLAPFADEIAVYPSLPLPAGAEAYALAFSIPVDAPGLIFLCRDSAATPDAHSFDRPLSTRFDEQDAATNEMLGELLDYVEVTRSAVLLSAEHGRDVGDGIWFPDGRALRPMRPLLATWFPRVNEMLTLIGSHNLLATPSRRELDDARLRPLLDEFLHGAKDGDAEARAALFRLAWDFVGTTLAGRNVLYERFSLTSAARNRINNHLRNVDRSRAYALVDGILAAGRAPR